MSGHCVVLLISTVFDHYGTPTMFYFLWIVFGGLSGLRMVIFFLIFDKLLQFDVLFQVSIYMYKTWSLKEGAILGCLSLILHMLSILYLRLEYHKVYEGILVVLLVTLFNVINHNYLQH